jgi:hypothetical protein
LAKSILQFSFQIKILRKKGWPKPSSF